MRMHVPTIVAINIIFLECVVNLKCEKRKIKGVCDGVVDKVHRCRVWQYEHQQAPR